VAAINGASISVIDPSKHRVIATVPTTRGVVALQFTPDGRFGLALNQRDSTVSVLDAATNAMIGAGQVEKEPDQVVFSRRYAYVRSLGSEKFSLLELGQIARGIIAPINIQGGQLSPGTRPREIGVADMIAPTPEGNSAMIASASDRLIYFYAEGMMASVGTLSNDKRAAHGLLILDRSLSETAPGVYTAPITLKRPGRFDVPFVLGQPRITHCFQAEIGNPAGGDRGISTPTITVKAMFEGSRYKPNDVVTLRFAVTNPATDQPIAGLTNVQVLVFERPGVWQQRQWANNMGAGVYAIVQRFPHAGLYSVVVTVPSGSTESRPLSYTTIPVVVGAETGDIHETSAANKAIQ
jgi:hypothetical protein